MESEPIVAKADSNRKGDCASIQKQKRHGFHRFNKFINSMESVTILGLNIEHATQYEIKLVFLFALLLFRFWRS
jgi:hypothetical protein